MAVVIRLARFGSIHAPKYRVTVADKRFCRDGRFLEVIGQFNPNPRGKEVGLNIDVAKAQAWIKKGAQPSPTVKKLIVQAAAAAKN